MPITTETPLMAPHGSANPDQFFGQGYSRFVVADTGCQRGRSLTVDQQGARVYIALLAGVVPFAPLAFTLN